METLAAREAGLPDPHPPESLNINVGGPVVPPMRGGALVGSQAKADLGVGELLRQPNVRSRDGAEERLDEFLGRSFCVVGRTPADLAIGPDAEEVLRRLGGRVVALDELEVVEGAMDRIFESHPAAVLRPDRYVFGVVDDDWSLDDLLVELGRMLSLRQATDPA